MSQKDVKSIATDGIGPVKIKLVSGPFVSKNIEEDRMRWLDDTTGRIHFRGEAFDIQPVIEAMENLSGNIKTRQTVLRSSSSRSETEL